ncbi:MAG: hypothetical protein K1X67_26150 [Fimbriimonadaceae bacterium]|nr:hypothetical protein [Fimbriimonadaceae bacterium]
MNASKLNYLTVQDMLWVNLQVTEKVNRFEYAELEEATYYQYGYGPSAALLEQAAKFLNGFAQKEPFASGDAATAFIGFVGFLSINGRHFKLSDDDAVAWMGKLGAMTSGDVEAASEKVGDGPLIEKTGEHGEPDVAATLKDALERYPKTVASLRPASAAAG